MGSLTIAVSGRDQSLSAAAVCESQLHLLAVKKLSLFVVANRQAAAVSAPGGQHRQHGNGGLQRQLPSFKSPLQSTSILICFTTAQVVSIDGTATEGFNGDRAAALLRGSAGTNVTVRLARRTGQVPGVAGRPEQPPKV